MAEVGYYLSPPAHAPPFLVLWVQGKADARKDRTPPRVTLVSSVLLTGTVPFHPPNQLTITTLSAQQTHRSVKDRTALQTVQFAPS
eukprot:scaffold71725_cov84-Phaeocystis_antarctica.AAC.3